MGDWTGEDTGGTSWVIPGKGAEGARGVTTSLPEKSDGTLTASTLLRFAPSGFFNIEGTTQTTPIAVPTSRTMKVRLIVV
jgi:hypothetical protein